MKRPRTATDGTAHYRDAFTFITRHLAVFDPSPEPCHACGDFHPGTACAESLVAPPTSCERPPENGPYTGRCAVRKINPEPAARAGGWKPPARSEPPEPGARVRHEDGGEALTVHWCGTQWAVLVRDDGTRLTLRLATVIKRYEVEG